MTRFVVRYRAANGQLMELFTNDRDAAFTVASCISHCLKIRAEIWDNGWVIGSFPL